MSMSVSIDINFIRNDISTFSAKDLIGAMLNNNWYAKKNDKICFLPVGDELYEWNESIMSEAELMNIIHKKDNNQETNGVNLYWGNTDIGISMLIFQDYQVSFNISINRIKLEELNNVDLTDVNWYLKRIINCFDNFRIGDIRFNQTW